MFRQLWSRFVCILIIITFAVCQYMRPLVRGKTYFNYNFLTAKWVQQAWSEEEMWRRNTSSLNKKKSKPLWKTYDPSFNINRAIKPKSRRYTRTSTTINYYSNHNSRLCSSGLSITSILSTTSVLSLHRSLIHVYIPHTLHTVQCLKLQKFQMSVDVGDLFFR